MWHQHCACVSRCLGLKGLSGQVLTRSLEHLEGEEKAKGRQRKESCQVTTRRGVSARALKVLSTLHLPVA